MSGRNTSTERIRAITDMMYELGMYTQSETVDELAKERDKYKSAFEEASKLVREFSEKHS